MKKFQVPANAKSQVPSIAKNSGVFKKMFTFPNANSFAIPRPTQLYRSRQCGYLSCGSATNILFTSFTSRATQPPDLLCAPRRQPRSQTLKPNARASWLLRCARCSLPSGRRLSRHNPELRPPSGELAGARPNPPLNCPKMTTPENQNRKPNAETHPPTPTLLTISTQNLILDSISSFTGLIPDLKTVQS